MQNNKKKITIIGVIGLILLLVLVGVTYAFFSYTKTGTNNVVQAGRIYFRTQETDTISLTNAFPITRTMAAADTNNTNNTDDLVIAITGDTTYSGGVEYLVTATNVINTVGNKTVPISIIATVSNGVGTSDDSYFTNRGGNSSIYKVLANETIAENDELLVGYIAPDNNQTGINGTLTIRAYLDYDLIIISDSYTLTENDINQGKVVLTTTEWNSFTGNNALSFKIKVEAREETWVTAPVEPLPTIASCPNCRYMYTTQSYYYGENGTPIEDITETISDDYNDVITEGNTFVGFTESNGKIERAFACGINPTNGMPFCIEGSTDFSTYAKNRDLLISIYGEAPIGYVENGAAGCYDDLAGDYFHCLDRRDNSPYEWYTNDNGDWVVYANGGDFYVCGDGSFNCN